MEALQGKVEGSSHLNGHDQEFISAKVEKHSHLLEEVCPSPYNPITKQISPAEVNVPDSIEIGEKMEREYIAILWSYDPISSPIKTMSLLKKEIMGKSARPVIKLESIFLRLFMIGQQREINLAYLFAYELCTVPSSLSKEHGCLCKGTSLIYSDTLEFLKHCSLCHHLKCFTALLPQCVASWWFSF